MSSSATSAGENVELKANTNPQCEEIELSTNAAYGTVQM